MFDIGWSELVVIGVVALIAIGPKELPGVLRMIGQWMGKVRKMAGEFQGHFNEAMREAEMADLKKTFDDVRDAAKDLSGNNLLTSMTKDAADALKFDPPSDTPATPTTPVPPTPETFVEAEAHIAATEPLAVVAEHEKPLDLVPAALESGPSDVAAPAGPVVDPDLDRPHIDVSHAEAPLKDVRA